MGRTEEGGRGGEREDKAITELTPPPPSTQTPAEIFSSILPALVREGVICQGTSESAWVRAVEDQTLLRSQLKGMGLVAFVANGSVLPRKSGADERMMDGGKPFVSPESMEVEVRMGTVQGL